jgi:predicted amidohydrolase YtcJ
MSADLVLINGKIITMDSSNPFSEAIAIKGELIAKVGTNEQISSLINKNTRVIQLDGKTVIPGFIDTHIHVADFGRFLMWLDLKGSKSIKDIQDTLKKKVIRSSPGKWILGRGWTEKLFKKNPFPTCSDLDLVSPDNPVVLYHQSGKLCLVNSKGLELAKITKKTIIPLKDGIIRKDPITGDLTGILEGKALNLVWRVIPEPEEDELLEFANLAFSKIMKAGITSIHWMVSSTKDFMIIKEIKKKNLPLRLFVIIPFELWKKKSCLENELVRIGAIELSVDGYLAKKTAALHQPYKDNSGTKGKIMHTMDQLNSFVSKIIKSGCQLIFHAVGDKAIEVALNITEKNMKEINRLDHRVRFEQAALIEKSLLKRIKNHEIVFSVQPCVINSEFLTWSAIENLGWKRARGLYPLRTLIDNDIMVVCGSDCPMEPLDPLLGIQKIVDRKYFSEESVNVLEALAMYTINAAFSTKEENIKGSIVEEKLADLTVLSNDPTMISPSKIMTINVLNTIIGGKIVYTKQEI